MSRNQSRVSHGLFKLATISVKVQLSSPMKTKPVISHSKHLKKKKNRRSGGCHDYDWVGSGFTKHRHPPRAAKVFWIPRRRESICPHHDENITCAKSGFGLSSVLCSLGWWKFRGNCGFGIGFVGFFFRKTGNRN